MKHLAVMFLAIFFPILAMNTAYAGGANSNTRHAPNNGYKSGALVLNSNIHKTLKKRHGYRPVMRANAPLAYQLFCLKSPRQCRGGGAQKVTHSALNIEKIKTINASVNSSIRPRNDTRVDIWAANVSRGDCEDFALTKRQKLIALGFPASALRIAVTKTKKGEGHAVLVVKTDKGDRILDNRNNSVRNWGQTDLKPIKISGANPLVWSSYR